jgi:hypothetical protein
MASAGITTAPHERPADRSIRQPPRSKQTMATSDEIIVVSGLPRSGTSMMMNMLQAGGLELVTDGIREADEDNPKGYYEFEQIKKLKEDTSWLPNAKGKVVKGISQLLFDLPTEYSYRVVFMRRDLDEVLRSQKKMLEHRGTDTNAVPDEQMRAMFLRHLEQVTDWLRQQPNFKVLYINYNKMLAEPEPELEKLAAFFDGKLDAEAMRSSIDQRLYRNRAPKD